MREQLLRGELAIGVWGIGYIGYSSMAYFASRGVRCVGFDVDRTKVDAVNNGMLPIKNIEYWLGFDTKPLTTSGVMSATADWRDLIGPDIPVHLVCIPTEKNDKPYDGILVDVLTRLSSFRSVHGVRPLIIIESTLTPGTAASVIIPLLEKSGMIVGKDVLLGVAPRRDWFISPEKNLKNLPRVVGGTTPETTALMKEVYGIVCDTVLPAPDHRHAELVKSIENAYRHVEITLANQLSLAFPSINMRKVLELVGTKWNIGTYSPSFGTGGYCVPLSSQYVLSGADRPEKLGILRATIETDNNLPAAVAESIVRSGARKVGILGLAYKGDLKVHTLSPTLRIVSYLKRIGEGLINEGLTVKVHDPYYSAEEIKRLCGVETFTFPEGLAEFDTVLVVSDHRDYQAVRQEKLLAHLKGCKLIIDNTGIWAGLEFGETKYRLAGTAGWLE